MQNVGEQQSSRQTEDKAAPGGCESKSPNLVLAWSLTWAQMLNSNQYTKQREPIVSQVQHSEDTLSRGFRVRVVPRGSTKESALQTSAGGTFEQIQQIEHPVFWNIDQV